MQEGANPAYTQAHVSANKTAYHSPFLPSHVSKGGLKPMDEREEQTTRDVNVVPFPGRYAVVKNNSKRRGLRQAWRCARAAPSWPG